MRTSARNARNAKQVRNPFSHEFNRFLRSVGETSTGYGIHGDFFNVKCGGRLSMILAETCIMGLLEASDFDSMEPLAPLMSAIVDIFCSLQGSPITDI